MSFFDPFGQPDFLQKLRGESQAAITQSGGLFGSFGDALGGGDFNQQLRVQNSLRDAQDVLHRAEILKAAGTEGRGKTSGSGTPTAKSPANPTAATTATTATADVTGSARHRSMIEQAAREVAQQYGIDPSDLSDAAQAVLEIESGGDPNAVGKMTPWGQAQGAMQVMPFHFTNLTPEQMRDPWTNIRKGTEILAQQRAATGDWEGAAAAYYGTADPDYLQKFRNAYASIHAGRLTPGGTAPAPPMASPQPQPQTASPAIVPASQVSVNPQSRPGPGDLVPNQFEIAGAGNSGCGPAAVTAVLRHLGMNVEPANVVQRAGGLWDGENGMYGPEAEVALLGRYGVAAQLSKNVDANEIAQHVSAGHLVIVSTPRHYWVLQSAEPNGSYFVGASGTARGAQTSMTLDGIIAHDGGVNGIIYTG